MFVCTRVHKEKKFKLIELALIQGVLASRAVQAQTFQYLEMMETMGTLDLRDQKVQ